MERPDNRCLDSRPGPNVRSWMRFLGCGSELGRLEPGTSGDAAGVEGSPQASWRCRETADSPHSTSAQTTERVLRLAIDRLLPSESHRHITLRLCIGDSEREPI